MNQEAREITVRLRIPILKRVNVQRCLDSTSDRITENWPVPREYETCLEDIKRSHRAVPLRVFSNGKPVGIHDVRNTLTGAVVEMQFELHHYPIRQKNVDSFNASIQQIQVIQPGETRPQTAFKRQSMSEGPIEVPESIQVLHVEMGPAEKKRCGMGRSGHGHGGDEFGMCGF